MSIRLSISFSAIGLGLAAGATAQVPASVGLQPAPISATGVTAPEPVVTAPQPVGSGGGALPGPTPAGMATTPPTAALPNPPDLARVLSSTPVLQHVAVPRMVCTQDPAAAPAAPRAGSGAGALIGGLIGGAIGNAIGRGDGRAAATAIGIMGGAILGDQTERRDQAAASAPVCTTQTVYETRTAAWNVVYEYAGRQYTAQLPQDPGPWLRLQITPVIPPPQAASPWPHNAPMAMPMAPMAAPAPVFAPAVTSVSYVYPSAAAVAVWPVAATRVYPSVGVNLNLGYTRSHWRPPHHHRW